MTPINQVVVIGRDAPAWMAAAAIARSFGAAGVTVRVIELPSLLRATDCYSALPALDGYHLRVGLDDRVVLATCKAVPIAGQRFNDWAAAGGAFLYGYDREVAEARLEFTHSWTKGRQEGLKSEFETFSLAAMAARAGRVPVPQEGASICATFGYNMDARTYAALLRHCTLGLGMAAKQAMLADVELEGERIAAVILDDGERVEADLFIDASGPEGLLIGRLPGTELESWRKWLPCDRIMVASTRALHPLPSFSQISAFGQGWIGLFPMQDRTGIVAAYDSRHIMAEEMAESLPALARAPIDSEVAVSQVDQGIRRRCWVGNCVAIGESAFALEPLDAVQLHIAHNCISQLMTLFPVDADQFPEAEAYDGIIRYVASNLRDFQTAHYKLNQRIGEPLWDLCRNMAVPDTLQRKLDIFAARGHVPLHDFETFQTSSWASLFIGHGLIPQSFDPRLDSIQEQEQIAEVHRRIETIVRQVQGFPSVEDFIARTQQYRKARPAPMAQQQS
nr:tryptophan 7-halogenase [Sphingobium sp.]